MEIGIYADHSENKGADIVPINSNLEDLNFVVIKQLLKVVRRNIDLKISNITKLQQFLEIEEQELRKYFDKEKKLVGNLKAKK